MKKISVLFAITLITVIYIPVSSHGQKIQNKPAIFSGSYKEFKPTFAMQTQHRGTMYPHKALVYDWDIFGSNWTQNSAELYIYYPGGENMFIYSLATDLSDTMSKETTFCDMYGNITYESSEFKIGPDNWQIMWGSRSTLSYYAPNKLETKIDEDWDQSNEKWIFSNKSIYTHNGSGFLSYYIEQEWDTIQSSWINSYKNEFLYDGSNKNNEVIGYTWNNNTWQKEVRVLVSWYIFNPYNLEAINSDSIEAQEWDSINKQYVNAFKAKIIRDANGGSVETDYNWNNAWIPSNRDTKKYDASKNYTGSIQEEWNGTGWDKIFEEDFLLTYVSGNVTQKIERNWQQGDPTGVFTNSRKYDYSDFNSVKEKQNMQVKAYPQPFENYLIIEIPEILNQNTLVMLSDLNGKLMIRQILPNSTRQTQLDVSVLAAGSYILTIQTSNSKISKLVIKP